MAKARIETPEAKRYRASMMASMDAKRERLEGKARVEHSFTSERTKAVIIRRQQNELLLAKVRGELIVKDLVEKQAAFLLVALRQRILALPSSLARRMVNVPDGRQANNILREAMTQLLNELKDLPSKVVDPRWLETLEKDAGDDGKA
jgi:hypothetical protein